MSGISFIFVLNSSLVVGAAPYADAYHQAVDTGRPLVVLVGAEWCPYCVTMKSSVMPQLARRGVLQKAAYTELNSDRQPRLAGKIMSGSGIPQLIMYVPTDGGWRRSQLSGAQSADTVEAFLQRGIEQAAARTARKQTAVAEKP